jgi:hypothetical protein
VPIHLPAINTSQTLDKQGRKLIGQKSEVKRRQLLLGLAALNIKEGTPILTLRAAEVGGIKVMPEVRKGMWPENKRQPFYYF